MSQQDSWKAVIWMILGALLVAAAVLPWPAHAESGAPRVVKDPCGNVNWDRVTPFIANLHSHTVYGDGRAEPEQLIHNYAEAGYHILAITDHDNYHTTRQGERETAPTHETTWPWTRWIEEKPSRVWKRDGIETSAFFPGLGQRGMLAIRGNELTSDPHIVSLFNPCGFIERSRVPNADHDRERFACVEKAGGLAYWAHPAHYVPGGNWADRGFTWEEGIEYYGSLLAEYDSVPGIELQLGGQRDLEEELFDRLLAAYYRDHDLDSGARQWRHYTDGPVRLAPAFNEGRLYAASDDGHLHGLDAASGELAWRFRGGSKPADRAGQRAADQHVAGAERAGSPRRRRLLRGRRLALRKHLPLRARRRNRGGTMGAFRRGQVLERCVQ